MKKKKSQPKPQTLAGRFRRVMKANWPLLKIYLLFGLALLVVFTIIMLPTVYHQVIMPLNEFLALSSAWLLSLMGNEGVISSGTSVSSPRFGISIAEGCNGIYALAIVIAGIVAFPARWLPKLIGLALGIVFIMFLNYIRIIALWYAGLYSSFLFDTMHLYVWEFIIIVLGAGYWYFWYEKFVKTS
jgi:exosortase H (IPTLxxWG-CTERM-specific)